MINEPLVVVDAENKLKYVGSRLSEYFGSRLSEYFKAPWISAIKKFAASYGWDLRCSLGVNVQEKNRSRLVLKAPTMVEPSQAMLVPNFDIHMNKNVWVQEMVNFF